MIQRQLLTADFDHVALVIRSDIVDDDLFILEAVSTGVRLVRWSNLAKYIGPEPNKFFAQICWRRVNFERTTAIKKMFIEFSNQTIGHEYSLSVDKLTRTNTIIEKKVQTEDEIKNLLRQEKLHH